METHVEKRKLAAVMFADIEGYTALFQKNETGAFALLEQHRKDLKEIAEKHKGHIVKYYGDGSLTLFTSVIEASKCAIDLQQVSTQHQISLRIGLHMGEMIEKDKDVYGDAVNVASRIQAIGTSGSILVSKTVEDELKNHPDITTKSLGFVKLKNVKQAVEVFALTNSGLAVPHTLPGAQKRKIKRLVYLIIPLVILAIGALLFKNKIRSWFVQIGDECVIIPPFISHIPAPSEFDYFSTLASSVLIKAMGESAKANVIPYTTMMAYTNASVAPFIDNPALFRRWGADIEVRGEYTLEGKNKDILRISMSIIDLKKNRMLKILIPDVICQSSNHRECLDEIRNTLVGYWKSKKENLFHFTSDSAYINFNRAQDIWADPDKNDEAKSYLLKAIDDDPKFIDAWFLLLDFFHNEKKPDSIRRTIALIENLIPDLDQRQQNYLGFYKADLLGHNVQAFKSFQKEYQQSLNDLFINTTGMVLALESLNDPLITLQMFKQLDPEHMDLSTCDYCFTRFSLALKAYLDLFDLENARQLVEKIMPYAKKEAHYISLLKYYVMINDTLSINEVIQAAANKLKTSDDEAYFSLVTARMAAVNGDLALRNQYASRAIQLYEKEPSYNLARCYLLIGKLKEAKLLFQENLKKNSTNRNTFGNLGIIYAREGDKNSAEQMIEKLNKNINEFDHGTTLYLQGRIKAYLGDFNAALHYFKMALDKGIRFSPTLTFQNDPDMIIMNSNREYLSLLARNRLNTIH